MMSIFIDNHVLCNQNSLLSDSRALRGVIKGIFITVKSHGLGTIYQAERHVLMLSRGQDPGLRPVYFNFLINGFKGNIMQNLPKECNRPAKKSRVHKYLFLLPLSLMLSASGAMAGQATDCPMAKMGDPNGKV